MGTRQRKRGGWGGKGKGEGQEERGVGKRRGEILPKLVGNLCKKVAPLYVLNFTCCTNETGSVNIGSIKDSASCKTDNSNFNFLKG